MSDVQVQDAPTATEAGPNPTGDFIWYELMTTDPEGAKAFYDAVVGWNIGEAVAEYNGYRMIGRSDGKFAGGVLPISDEMAQHGAKAGWLSYIHVAEVDEASRSIEQSGGKVHMPPMDIPNVGRVAMVSDPQGAPFYVMKPTPPTNDPNAKSDVFSRSEVQRCGWNELATTEEKAAAKFYGDLFGWTSDNTMPMGEMGDYRFFDHHGEMIGAVFNSPDSRARWRYYFRVPSIKDAKQTAEQKGGTVHMGPHQVPTGDWIILGADPQGAEFALVGAE